MKTLSKILDQFITIHSDAKYYLVGGCVRDALLHGNFQHDSIKDYDVEVFNIMPLEFENILTTLNLKYDNVGKSFGVYKVSVDGEIFDFAFPRKEVKNGVGYKGFDVQIDPFLSIEDAAKRRDLTLNSIYFDWNNQCFVDPFDGKTHIAQKTLYATSEYFSDDPLRVLRVFQFASRFAFDYSDELILKGVQLLGEKETLSKERVWVEWEKWCTKSKTPSIGLKYLNDCKWIEDELFNLKGIQQDPKYHPEGDVWQHTLHVCDAAAIIRDRENLSHDGSIVLLLSALCHDMGKPLTTIFDGSWKSPNHANEGVAIAESFLQKIGCPKKYHKSILVLVKKHMACVDNVTERMVRRLNNEVISNETTINMLSLLIEADHSGRPPLSPKTPSNLIKIMNIFKNLSLVVDKKITPIVNGDDLISFGFVEGKELGDMLKFLYEKQMDGEIIEKSDMYKFI